MGYRTLAGEFCTTNREFSDLWCLLNTLIQSCILMRESLLFLTFFPWNITCICSVYMSAGFILEIDQWGSNGPPSLIFEGPFSRNGAPNPKKLSAFWDFWHSTWVTLAGCFAAILEHSGQLKKPGLKLLHIPDVCLVK